MRHAVVCVTVWLFLGIRAQWLLGINDRNKEENEECYKDGNSVWLCKKDIECSGLKPLLQKGEKPRTCSWKDGRIHVICCPPEPSSEPYTASISEKACSQYEGLTCYNNQYQGYRGLTQGVEIGKTKRQITPEPPPLAAIGGQNAKPRVHRHMKKGELLAPNFNGGSEDGGVHTAAIGGQLAEPAQHPHMAIIGYGNEGSITWQCGGSLISERYVLSAAHCSVTAYGLARWARLGDLDIFSDKDDARPQQFEIIERIAHRDYKSPAFYNDIVLFRLDRDAVFDQYVGPACLYRNPVDPIGQGIATGWGKNESNGPRSSGLVEVDLKFIPTEECKRNVGTIKEYLPQGLDTRTMLCAGEPGKDTCQGDSGGPLILADRGGYCLPKQVGVTSFGPKDCGRAKTTGAYVRVAYFVPWIESIVWPQ